MRMGFPPMMMSSAGGVASHATPTPADPKLAAQVQEQAKQLSEQEAMIKTLNKQLTHCEGDLQAHMEMVATLETSLADAEKNCECRLFLGLPCMR